MFYCGRAIENAISTIILPQFFIKKWLEGRAIAKRYNKEIFCSASDLTTLKNSFCRITTPNFCITPQGLVTACFSVCTIKKKLGKLSVYGYYNPKTKSFVFDQEKILQLQTLNYQ